MTLMTLNAVIALILLFSPNSIALQADYVKVAEDRSIMSVKYCLPVPVFYIWSKLTHPAARFLFDSEHLVQYMVTPNFFLVGRFYCPFRDSSQVKSSQVNAIDGRRLF